MQRPENVPYDHNYHCFRETVIPMWEVTFFFFFEKRKKKKEKKLFK